MILDTSIVIDRVKRGAQISENITSITLIEYPPVMGYEKFTGTIYFASYLDQVLAIRLQAALREKGSPLSASDLLIAAICINRGEPLLTRDKDFLAVRDVWPGFQVIVVEKEVAGQ